jgi:hypothetical protein
MNRLMQRLAYLESHINSEGRAIVIVDDGTEDIDARKERCYAEVGISPRDIVIIRRSFFDEEDRDAGPFAEQPWTVTALPRRSSRP